ATWKAWNAFRRPRGNLLGLALEARALRVAWARDKSTTRLPSAVELLEFVERAVSRGQAVTRWVEEALARRTRAVEMYDAGRVARVDRAETAKDDYYEDLERRLGLREVRP